MAINFAKKSRAGFLSDDLNISKEKVQVAASISKSDLCSDLVGEYPELQGPAMNLIPAKVLRNGKGAQIEISREGKEPILLHDQKAIDLPEKVILGLRPEDIAEAGFRAGENIQEAECHVEMVEPAGADTYVVSELGGKQVTARLHAETRASAGENLRFAFDLAKASYFEPETGNRLN